MALGSKGIWRLKEAVTMTRTIKEEAARLAEKRNTEAPKSSAAYLIFVTDTTDMSV